MIPSRPATRPRPRTGRVLVLVLALALPGATRAAQDDGTLPGFLTSLRQAVAGNQRGLVASLMRYPLNVRAGGLQIPVADRDAFMKLYDTIFTPALKDVVTRARVPASGPLPSGVIRTPNGGVVFEGAVTVLPASGGFRVTAITVPLGTPRATSPGERVGRRLTFRAGTPTLVSGTLAAGGRDQYLFFAARGAFVEARLTGIPGRTALLRLLDDTSAKPVDARADAGTRVWTGRVPAAATYRLDVVRQPDTGTEPLIYTLSVAVK